MAAGIAQRLFPRQPLNAGFLRQQVLFLEAHGLGELERAFAHQEHVVGLRHDQLGDFGRRLDIAQGAHGAAAAAGPVHATGIQLHHAFLIGQPAIADAVVAGVQFHDVDAGDDGVERVAPGLDEFHRLGAAVYAAIIAVGAGDDHGLGTRLRRALADERECGRAQDGGPPAEFDAIHCASSLDSRKTHNYGTRRLRGRLSATLMG